VLTGRRQRISSCLFWAYLKRRDGMKAKVFCFGEFDDYRNGAAGRRGRYRDRDKGEEGALRTRHHDLGRDHDMRNDRTIKWLLQTTLTSQSASSAYLSLFSI
jgi:hypothetical protein